MVRFNKEQFETAPEKNQQSLLPKDVYELELTKWELNKLDSGAEMLNMTWEVDDSDNKYDGRSVFDNICVTSKNGELNDIGLAQFNDLTNKLSDGRFDPDVFEYDEDDNVTNMNEVLHQFLKTRVLAEVDQKPDKKDERYTRTKIKIQKILHQEYASTGPSVAETSTQPDPEPTYAKVGPGDIVLFKYNDSAGKGKIVSEIGDAENGMLLVDVVETLKGKRIKEKQIGLHPVKNDVRVAEGSGIPVDGPEGNPINPEPEDVIETTAEVIEEVVEEVKPRIEKGAVVNYQVNGEVKSGKIHDVDEDAETCRIFINEKQVTRVPFSAITS